MLARAKISQRKKMWHSIAELLYWIFGRTLANAPSRVTHDIQQPYDKGSSTQPIQTFFMVVLRPVCLIMPPCYNAGEHTGTTVRKARKLTFMVFVKV